MTEDWGGNRGQDSDMHRQRQEETKSRAEGELKLCTEDEKDM